MNNITYSQDNCKEETTSTWLIAIMQFGLKINFFKPFEYFKLKMKKVKYSVYQKLIITMMSIVIGCETSKDINEKLGVEKLAANMFDMYNVPDQSQINLLLTRMNSDSISQLQDIHNQLFMEHSNSIYSTQRVVVDCDQTGLIANGKTFELAEKGYFAKKKNQRGYQLADAFTGEYSETVAMFLDSGSSHCNKHYDELLSSILFKYKDQLRNGNLILRTDSGFGSAENIEKLLSIPKLKFITKGYSTVKAKNLAKDIPYQEYTQADEAAWVYELSANDGLRYIIVQTLSKKGNLKYSLLISNISRHEMSSVELFHFYNKRQTIEAFFKMAKNVYNIKKLRTSKFYGIYAFLWLVFITHNLISQFKSTVLYGTELENVGVRVLVKSIGNIKGFVKRTTEGIKVTIPPLTKLSNLIANALCTPKYEQLTFNI
ncbi:transposase [Clostridium magnum]|uniref:Transposase DDE domain protein n=1 Tax=Clostridium magnum DSM 2767 TaxID=1121326 RepID=A0A162U732_9CLOT|nr:transposase [Clostridium magnum]KZL93605.1 transposase DDE domain protein [Clostridium magnum DSM 2767]SHI58225.1 Transposase DDE domain-containing protein [Clostridium magnum DSM 2767]